MAHYSTKTHILGLGIGGAIGGILGYLGSPGDGWFIGLFFGGVLGEIVGLAIGSQPRS